MEFDEIVVKESPGLCRCCLSEGCYKDLGTEYVWMDDTEVYADMLLECFDIGISQHMEGPNGPNRLICEVCITRLRDACNFKKQVLESEQKFIDMVGRGDFKNKAVYQDQLKCEITLEGQPVNADVEFLDEDVDYDDPPNNDEATVSEDITVSTLPIKSKRGRPKKTVVKEKKKTKTEEKAKTKVKGKIKKKSQETCSERLTILRRNIQTLLQYGNIVPFTWTTRGFRCFYCTKHMNDCETLKHHTIASHKSVNLPSFIPQRIITKDIPVKIDITDLSCKFCDVPLTNIEDLITHIVVIHDEKYDESVGVCVFPFILNKDILPCVLCEDKYDNFTSMMGHMHKKHMCNPYICQICGASFIDRIRLNRHINNCHVGYKCKHCKTMFDSFYKLEEHKQRIHGISKVVMCDLCSATFKTQYQLKVHMGKNHNVEKYRIKCEHCPKICTTKGAMLLHIQSLHSVAKFECDLCDYKTGIKWMIKLHKRKHFGERNYECTICTRRFGRSSNLRAHMKTHTGNFGRVCRWCRHGFIDTESLEKHQKEVHNELPK